jgi:hypothetical protein
MDKQTELLMKERLPVHPKCRGEGFSEEERKFLRTSRCSRIEPVNIYDVIDEQTGEVDQEKTPAKDFTDEFCRCTTYVNPSNWWKNPTWRCPMGDHYRPDMVIEKGKGRIGQQKQKKKR